MININERRPKPFSSLWVLFTIFAAGSILWKINSALLIKIFILFKKYELIIINQLTENGNIEQALKGLQITYENPQALTTFYALTISSMTGNYLALPLLLLCFVLVVLLVKKFPSFSKIKEFPYSYEDPIEIKLYRLYKSPEIRFRIFMIFCTWLILILAPMILKLPEFAELFGIVVILIFAKAYRAKLMSVNL